MAFYTLNNDTEKHYLQHEYASKRFLIEEPKGWKFSNKKISRSKTTGELVEKNAKNVEFIGKGRSYIKNADALYGSNLKIRYTIIKQNPKDATDFFKDVYFIDLESIKDKDNKLSCKIDEGGLSKLLKSKGNEKVELDRETSLTGNRINSLKTEVLEIKGRKIFLKTFLKSNKDAVYNSYFTQKSSGTKWKSCIPLDVEGNNHIDFVNPVSNTSEFVDHPDSSQVFFLENDRTKTLNLTLKGSIIINIQKSFVLAPYCKFFLTKYKRNSSTSELEEVEKIFLGQDKTPGKTGQRIVNFDKNLPIRLKEKESLCFHSEIYGKDIINDRCIYDVQFKNPEILITLEEDSVFPSSSTECIYPLEGIDRHLEIITGKKGLFKSSFFGRKDVGYTKDGEGAYAVMYPLLWVRGFKKKPNQPKPATSLNDTINSYNAIFGCSTMIEKKGFNEYLRLEPLDFFYIHKPLIELPNVVENIEIEYASGFLNTSYEVGYEKGGSDYEEATGIGEYNGYSLFTTIRNRKEKKKVIKSKYRTDSSAEEFARRKPFKTNAQEDTRYDSDWFIKDAKKGNSNTLVERTYNNDYIKKPTGIYSPETATNLRFSPLQMLLRHSFFIKGNLSHYANSFLTFLSSNCNTNLELVSKKGVKTKESQNVLVKSMGKPKFKPYWCKFKHDVSFDIQKKLRGKTVINGEEFYNFYGLVKFRVSENKYKYGYLFEVKENKGDWKVLLANY